jgi:hypothetical protein
VVQIDETYYENLSLEQLDALLDSQLGKNKSAP